MDELADPASIVQGARLVTREHKFALILGFSVVLVAAILLSDHLSRARQDRSLPADLVQIPAPGVPVPSEIAITKLNNDRALRDPAPPEGAGKGSSGPIINARNDVSPPAFIPAETPGANDPDTTNGTAESANSNLPISSGKEQIITIKSGDGLYKICSRIYGNGGLYKELEAYNKGTAGFNPANLKVGSTVRVPPKDVLLGKSKLGSAGDMIQDEKPATSPLPRNEDGIASSKTKSYKVVDGDTGAAIARKTLGDKNRWDEIAKLNPGVDPRGLKIGYELKIPAK